MKRTKDKAYRVAENIRAWWVGKGCIENSDMLRDEAERRVRRVISDTRRREMNRCLDILGREWSHHLPGTIQHGLIRDLRDRIRKGTP